MRDLLDLGGDRDARMERQMAVKMMMMMPRFWSVEKDLLVRLDSVDVPRLPSEPGTNKMKFREFVACLQLCFIS